MNVNQLKQSNFLTRHDVGKGMLVTVRGDVFQENVAKAGAPEELRYCLAFEECEKPMVLNSTNGQILAQITGSQESEHWAGHKIVLFDDPTVSFGGKLVGGIRIRAPRNQPSKPVAKPAAKSAPAPEPGPAADQDGRESDDVPF